MGSTRHTRSRIAIAATFIVALTGAATLVAQPAPGPEFSELPPKPAEVQQQLAGLKVSLAQAIDIAQKEIKGTARSASLIKRESLPAFEVLVYAGGAAQRITIDAATGKVLDKATVPWLPGQEFQGELVTHESGLRYADIRTGNGDEITSNDDVAEFHFKVFLANGTMFHDSQAGPGEPTILSLTGMFPGLQHGLKGMKAGGVRKLIVPPDLHPWPQGNPPVIPAGALVIFDVDLRSVNGFSKMPDVLPGEPVHGEPVRTESGLIYYDLVKCEGEQPEGPDPMVRVHYTGYLVNGKKFASSHDANEPQVMRLSQLISGWREGLSTMTVGSKRKLIIPSELAYRDEPPPGIPPKAMLIFDIELLDIIDQ